MMIDIFCINLFKNKHKSLLIELNLSEQMYPRNYRTNNPLNVLITCIHHNLGFVGRFYRENKECQPSELGK